MVDRNKIRKAIQSSLLDVYRLVASQGDQLSEKQEQFVILATNRVMAELGEVPLLKQGTPKVTAFDRLICPTCGDTFKSQSGLTLHKKKCL